MLNSYSKNPNLRYGGEDRRNIQRTVSQEQADEITKGRQWLELAILAQPELQGLEPFLDGSIGLN